MLLPDGKYSYLFTQGKSGRINLPGGGLENGESPEDAALREFYEETGCELSPRDIKPLVRMQDLAFSSSDDQPIKAEWFVYETVRRPVDIHTLATSSEVDQLHVLDFAQIISKEIKMSDAAKAAIYIHRSRSVPRTGQFALGRVSSMIAC